MSGIRFFSTGGSLMNLTSPAWPGTAMATLQPFRSLRSRNVASASRTSSSGSASGWLRILGYSMKSNASATTWSGVSPGTSLSALSAAWPMSIAQTAWIFAMRTNSFVACESEIHAKARSK